MCFRFGPPFQQVSKSMGAHAGTKQTNKRRVMAKMSQSIDLRLPKQEPNYSPQVQLFMECK